MILASITLAFAGSTGSYSHALPPNATGCFEIDYTATFSLASEVWGAQITSGSYYAHATIWTGWTLTSGSTRIANGRASGVLNLSGAIERFDGAIDFDESVTVQASESQDACASPLGADITMHGRDWMVLTAGYGYTFAPGSHPEAHVWLLTGESWAATVEVETR